MNISTIDKGICFIVVWIQHRLYRKLWGSLWVLCWGQLKWLILNLWCMQPHRRYLGLHRVGHLIWCRCRVVCIRHVIWLLGHRPIWIPPPILWPRLICKGLIIHILPRTPRRIIVKLRIWVREHTGCLWLPRFSLGWLSYRFIGSFVNSLQPW